jgi:hypothetical protein
LGAGDVSSPSNEGEVKLMLRFSFGVPSRNVGFASVCVGCSHACRYRDRRDSDVHFGSGLEDCRGCVATILAAHLEVALRSFHPCYHSAEVSRVQSFLVFVAGWVV